MSRPPHHTAGGQRRARAFALAVLGIALVAIATFWPVMTFGFVYDDRWTVTQNRWLAGPLGPILGHVARGTAHALAIPDASRPAMIVSTWLDRHAFGLEPAGYHAHSLALYALAVGLSAVVLLGLTRSRRISLAGAAFFAVAPLHAEVAACINYREDLLSAIGVLFPLACALGRRRSGWLALLAAGAWGIGLLGKESSVALLPLLALAAVHRGHPGRWARSREPLLVSLGVVLVVWGSWRWGVHVAGEDIPTSAIGSPLDSLLRTARFEVRAVGQAVFPVGWAPEHVREGAPSAAWLAALAGLLALGLVLARRRATRVPAVGIALALLAALPSSPLAHPVNEQADRYLFLPILGGAAIWGFFYDRVARRLRPGMRPALLLVLCLPLAVMARRAASPWRSELQLWRAATELAPDSSRAWAGLSRACRLEGDAGCAETSADRAIALEPAFVPAQLARVNAALARGDVDQARRGLDAVRALGGADLAISARSLRCAAMAPAEAEACIRAEP